MSYVLNDVVQAFGYAANADPLSVLLPLIVITLVQGLVTRGPAEAVSRALSSLVWLGIAVFVFAGILAPDRFDFGAWQTRLAAAWDELMRLRVMEALGFYLLLLAGILLVGLVRMAVRR